MLKAVFTMPLRQQSKIITGSFTLFLNDALYVYKVDPENIENSLVARWPATSGLPGYQTEDHFWTRGKGPCPRTLPGRREYTMNIRGRYPLAKKGIEGIFYPMSPDPIRQVGGGDGMRSEIGVHLDKNVDGSSGCIVLRITDKQYEEFNSFMWSLLTKFDIKDTIPFEVVYT